MTLKRLGEDEIEQKVEVKTNKEATQKKIVVVKELPTEVVRHTKLEDGTEVEFITIEEALTGILNARVG